MVLGQIRKDRHVEFTAFDPVQGQGVRGNFKNRGIQPRVHHTMQERLQRNRTRCCVTGRLALRPDVIPHRAHETRPVTATFQDRLTRVCHRGFPIRSRHADHAQGLGGTLKKPRGQLTERLPGILDFDPGRSALFPDVEWSLKRSLHHNAPYLLPIDLSDKCMTINLLPFDGDKQTALCDFP